MLVCLSACEVRGSAGEEEKKNTGPRVTRQPSQELLCGRDFSADNTNKRTNRRRKMTASLGRADESKSDTRLLQWQTVIPSACGEDTKKKNKLPSAPGRTRR